MGEILHKELLLEETRPAGYYLGPTCPVVLPGPRLAVLLGRGMGNRRLGYLRHYVQRDESIADNSTPRRVVFADSPTNDAPHGRPASF